MKSGRLVGAAHAAAATAHPTLTPPPPHRSAMIPCRRLVGARGATRTYQTSEQKHFAALADSWWDPDGPQRILHKMNLMRMDFIRETLANAGGPGYSRELLPAEMRPAPRAPRNLRFLDVGCGGGLLSESLARADFSHSVKGIDITPEVLEAAKVHRARDPALTNIEYELRAVEELPRGEKFDCLTMFEVVEHLEDPASTLSAALELVKPGGWAFLSTINRTALAYLTTIFAAEQVFRIVPPGTHTFKKYVNEHELREYFDKHPEWQFARSQGCLYIPGSGWKRFSNGLLERVIGRDGGNYLLAARKQ